MRTAAFALAVLLAAPLARAIELSLEENRAERGSVGYVDMQKVFQLYPETVRSKENFEELVRQAEEQMNLRKAEILRLRNELSELRIERDFAAKTPIVVQPSAPATAPAPAAPPKEAPKAPEALKPAVSTPTVVAAPPAVSTHPVVAAPPAAATQPAAAPAAAQQPLVISTRPAIADLPGLSPPKPAPAPGPAPQTRTLESLLKASAAANAPSAASLPPQAPAPAPTPAPTPQPKAPEPLVINIPGISTAPIVVQPPAGLTETPKPAAPAVASSTAAHAASPAAPAVAASSAPLAAVNPALAELDAKVALKTQELAQKESDFREYQAAQEKNLLDLESRKTEILLGRINRAIQEVAKKEGISVVIDKSSMVFGHDAVDLTAKVLKFLQGS